MRSKNIITSLAIVAAIVALGTTFSAPVRGNAIPDGGAQTYDIATFTVRFLDGQTIVATEADNKRYIVERGSSTIRFDVDVLNSTTVALEVREDVDVSGGSNQQASDYGVITVGASTPWHANLVQGLDITLNSVGTGQSVGLAQCHSSCGGTSAWACAVEWPGQCVGCCNGACC